MFQSYTLTNIEDVPAKVVDFVNTNMTGWTAALVTPGPNGEVRARIDMPADGTDPAQSFDLMALNGATVTTDLYGGTINNYIHIFFTNDLPAPLGCRIPSPCYATGSGAVDAAPRLASALYLFGGTGPAGYVAGAVEFGANRFRHFYIGRVAKRGGYTGGQIISGTMVKNSKSTFGSPAKWHADDHARLFQANEGGWYGDRITWPGGVWVDHPDNPNPLRKFHADTAYNMHAVDRSASVMGGFRDGPIDPLVTPAGQRTLPSGRAALIPVELFAPLFINGAAVYVPIGHPAGVRVLDMTGLSPGDAFTVGAETWRVFPEARLDLANETDLYGTSQYFVDEENSGPLGLAYRE